MNPMEKHGGPAFPQTLYRYDGAESNQAVIDSQHFGMSLCDWFAGNVAACLFDKWRIEESLRQQYSFTEWSLVVARDSYIAAEAMIAERERRTI